MSNFHKVYEFHKKFGATIAKTDWTFDDLALRYRLIFTEEGHELGEEFYEIMDTLELAEEVTVEMKKRFTKELCDLLYVIYGTGVALGIDLNKAFDQVHRSNMSKLGDDGKPIVREDGKILKGPNYWEPTLEGVF